jgi:hypothetical protein
MREPVARVTSRGNTSQEQKSAMSSEQFVAYRVWDAPARLFHWINAVAVLGLMLLGIVILFAGDFGVTAAGKVTLKTIHVSIGYVMVVNLLWRFVWAFFGNRYARWNAILPGGRGYLAGLEAYVSSFLSGAQGAISATIQSAGWRFSSPSRFSSRWRRQGSYWRERTSSIRRSGTGSRHGSQRRTSILPASSRRLPRAFRRDPRTLLLPSPASSSCTFWEWS